MVDDLTPEQVDALRIVDNKTNESPWDIDLLAEELQDLDLSMFDFAWETMEEAADVALDLDDEPSEKKSNAEMEILHCPKCGFAFSHEM